MIDRTKPYKMKYAGSRGKGVIITLSEDPRKGKCECCGKIVGVDIKMTALHHWYYAYQPETVRKNPVLALENTIEVCYGCLPPNEKIYTESGIKSISEINNKDKVILNSLSNVIETYIHDFNGILYKIKPKYFLPFKLTNEHPILVRKIKRYAYKNRYEFLGEPYFIPSEKLQSYNRNSQINLRVAIPKILKSDKTSIQFKNKTLETDYELGLIFGTYIADGYFTESSRVISFDFNYKTEKLKSEKFQQVLNNKGFKNNISIKNNVLTVYVCNVEFGRYLKSIFGIDCYRKHIPYWIFETNNDFLEGIIDGALNDGCFVKSTNNYWISTVSEELARGLQLILWKLRKPASISFKKPNRKCIIEGRLVNETSLFSVYWSIKSSKIIEDEKYYWISIRNISKEHYIGKVYNFATTENIYSLPIIVHNCHQVADAIRALLYASPSRVAMIADCLKEPPRTKFKRVLSATVNAMDKSERFINPLAVSILEMVKNTSEQS